MSHAQASCSSHAAITVSSGSTMGHAAAGSNWRHVQSTAQSPLAVTQCAWPAGSHSGQRPAAEGNATRLPRSATIPAGSPRPRSQRAYRTESARQFA